MPDNKTVHVMVRMDPELHAQMKAAAEAHDLSLAQVIRMALRGWLIDPRLTERIHVDV